MVVPLGWRSRQPRPPGGGRLGFAQATSRAADALLHRRATARRRSCTTPAGHQPRRPRRRPRDRRRGHVHRARCRAVTRGRRWPGPTRPRRARRRRSSSAWTSREPRPRDAARRAAARPRLSPVRERPPRRQRLDLAEHAARIGALWSRFSEVAADNPHAWIRTARTPTRSSPRRPTTAWSPFPTRSCAPPTCRWTRAPAYIVCSAEAARAAGVPEERWVFPLAGADGNDHWYISDRAELHRPRHPPRRGGRARAGGARHRRRRLRGPLLVLPRGRADGGARARAAPSTIPTGP